MKVEWGEYLSVGVAEIDGQHRELFDRFNALLEAYENGSAAGEITRLFTFLEVYVVTHFSDEERLMQRIGFPAYLKHREVHKGFIRQVEALRERLENEGPNQGLIATVTLTVNGWLIEHNSWMDREIEGSRRRTAAWCAEG